MNNDQSVNEDLSAGDFFKSMHHANGLDHAEKLMLAVKIIVKIKNEQLGRGKDSFCFIPP